MKFLSGFSLIFTLLVLRGAARPIPNPTANADLRHTSLLVNDENLATRDSGPLEIEVIPFDDDELLEVRTKSKFKGEPKDKQTTRPFLEPGSSSSDTEPLQKAQLLEILQTVGRNQQAIRRGGKVGRPSGNKSAASDSASPQPLSYGSDASRISFDNLSSEFGSPGKPAPARLPSNEREGSEHSGTDSSPAPPTSSSESQSSQSSPKSSPRDPPPSLPPQSPSKSSSKSSKSSPRSSSTSSSESPSLKSSKS